jgi:hypothetical protein
MGGAGALDVGGSAGPAYVPATRTKMAQKQYRKLKAKSRAAGCAVALFG